MRFGLVLELWNCLVGIVVFKEPATFGEFSLTTLISIVGLKFVSSH
jgi:hypothetical protein